MTKKELLVQETIEIIKQYTTKLTLRQIFYRLYTKQIIDNTNQEYKYLSSVLVDARINGLIPFDSIEDRTRRVHDSTYYTISKHLLFYIEYADRTVDPPQKFLNEARDYLENCLEYFELPRWLNQKNYVEVWLEKEALSGLFQQTTSDLHVRLAPCRGYPSLTFMYEASKVLKTIPEPITILYFGDFDPSGMDIERHIQERFIQFGIDAKVIRIGITREQIDQYNIPPMPTKKSDARTASFMEEHGDIAVELDALEPDTLQKMIKDNVLNYFDKDTHTKVINERDNIKSELEDKLATLNLEFEDEE